MAATSAEHSAFFLQVLTLVGTTTIVATVFHSLRLPTIVGFIASGVIIGPYGLGLVSSIPGAELLSEIGVIFLMFTIGLEFSISKLKQFRKPFLGLGLAQVLGTILLTFLIFYFAVGAPWQKSLFFGYLLSLSSTAIVVKLLQDSRESESPYGVASIGVLLCQDLAVIPMMLSLPLLVAAHSVDLGLLGSEHILGWSIKFAVVVVGLVIGGRYVFPFLLERVAKTRSRELFFSAVLLLCFSVAFALEKVGLSLSFGAFIAGLMIAESTYGRQATSDIIPMRDNFLGLFFASVGMLVDPQFVLLKLHWIVLIVISVLIIKSGIVFAMARLLRYPATTALISGLTVFQLGEFSFILSNTGKTLGLMNSQELQMFLSVSVITMMLTPFIFQMAPRWAFSAGFAQLTRFDLIEVPQGIISIIREPAAQVDKASNKALSEHGAAHSIVIGYGVAGQNVASAFQSLKIPYKVIEQNLDLVHQHKKRGIPISFGDASRAEILEHAGIEDSKLVVVAISGVQMTSAVVKTIRDLRPDVHIVIRTQYSREATAYSQLKNADVVIAEYETTIEILVRSLLAYGVDGDEIHSLMAKTRKDLRTSGGGWSDVLRKKIDLPAWETVAAIRPIIIKKDYSCVGKNLAELALRQQSGVTIVAVFREGLGTAIPTGDFVIEAGDVLHVIGSEESQMNAKSLLAGSQRDVSVISRL
jgi:CPA2 family monovalent cation:H+ antiporter-2